MSAISRREISVKLLRNSLARAVILLAAMVTTAILAPFMDFASVAMNNVVELAIPYPLDVHHFGKILEGTFSVLLFGRS